MMLVILALVSAIALALYPIFSKLRRPTEQPVPSSPRTKTPEKERPFGVWDAISSFSYPKVTPWSNFNVDAAKPIPFRPFRWGPTYAINMGIRPMKWDNWIELDSDYRKTHAIRLERTNNTEKQLSTATVAGYRPQAMECLCEIASFMAARYPEDFVVTRAQYDAEKPETHGDSLVGPEGGAVTSVRNNITGEFHDFAAIAAAEGPDWNPMRVAGLLTMDDLAVMVETDEGEYALQAGSICTAGFWRLEDKIGLTLEGIHSTGSVPGWKDKLKFSMERFFQKMKVDKPVERNNYFFQIGDELSWSVLTNGPEKAWDHTNKCPKPDILAASEDPSWKEPVPTTDFNNVWYRTERQTLRRMPKTGCILFTIRTYFHRVADFASERGVPGRMASAIRSWPKEVQFYKGAPLYGDVLLTALDALHEEQLADGLEMDEEGHVVGAARYPF